MSFGINLGGRNNSLVATTNGKNFTFRGLATYQSVSLPVNALNGVDNYVVFQGRFPSQNEAPPYLMGPFANGTATSRFIQREVRPSGLVDTVRATISAQNTLSVLLYTIVAPGEPVVFINTNTVSTKCVVSSIRQNGTSAGVPIWEIQVSVGFLVGTSTATIVSQLSLYCFSEFFASEGATGHGLNIYTGTTELAFSSNARALTIQDFVEVTSSSSPVNIADMIYTRNFSANPSTPTLSISKPGFLNTDFARYHWRQQVSNFDFFYGFPNRQFLVNVRADQRIISSGVARSVADLDFGLSVFDAELTGTVTQIPFTFTLPPLPANFIISKSESFPVKIPVINCSDYD